MAIADPPRITFGMIVLNGEPFVKYNLRALYPFAHEIIVVEGATPHARNAGTLDGHSLDTTLETLELFKTNEDPENKLQIITKDGYWDEKDEMSRAYAERATGDYLWQIDSDEFYMPDDMRQIIQMLRGDPTITAVSFTTRTFWGGLDYVTDGWYLKDGAGIFHRIFKWGDGYQYVTHRPPTVYDDQGRDLRNLNWVNGHKMLQYGVIMHHYSLLFPQQVRNKAEYYRNLRPKTRGKELEWAQNSYLRLDDPLHVHNVYTYPSWLERYDGQHPPQIVQMWECIVKGKLDVDVRHTDDIDTLLRSVKYRIKRSWLRISFHIIPSKIKPLLTNYSWTVGLNYKCKAASRKIRQYGKQLLYPKTHTNPLAAINIAPYDGLKTLGTHYGGWTIPVDVLDENSICYCFGAGEDISFDVGLVRLYGCQVYIFDPTPRAIEHVSRLIQNTRENQQTFVNNDPEVLYEIDEKNLDNLHFYDFGVWKEDATLTFYSPQDPQHVSHSIVNLQKTNDGFEARCYTLASIMDILGHNHLSLLKLDIEGAEYAVLESMCSQNIRPTILCVEFDEGHNPLDERYTQRIYAALKQLIDCGYQIISRVQWDYTLIYVE